MVWTPDKSSVADPVISTVALEMVAFGLGYVMVPEGTTKSKLKGSDTIGLIFPPPVPSPRDALSTARTSKVTR